MFNLTESFKQEYSVYLQEKISKKEYNKSLEEYQEAQRYINEGMDLIGSYFSIYSRLNEAAGLSPEEKRNLQQIDDAARTSFSIYKDVVDDQEIRSSKDDMKYTPAIGMVTAKSITEMKFPENVIFFFQQLITWIVNLVKKFISFFTNAIRRLFALPEGEKWDEEVKLNLQKVKKIESVAMPLSFDAKDLASRKNFPKALQLVGIEPSDWEKFGLNLSESNMSDRVSDEVKGKAGVIDKERTKQVMAVNINISKEMEGIHQLLQYFLELFDNSYGSNREHLFGTEDLEMLMELFKLTLKDLREGNVASTAVSGKISSMQMLSADKLKDNMIRTKVNTDKLKEIYAQISNSVGNMLAILSHKQLVAAEGLGTSYRFYSASTYIQMIKILDAIKPRIKQAEKMEVALRKMKERFDKIVVELGKQRQALLAFGDVVYTSAHQKRIAELFDASRYVSQTISLRLATLGLFIRQIKDIQESIYNVNAINQRSKSFLKPNPFSL